MNHRKGLKTLLFFTAAVMMFFTCNTKSFASDYQYKVLDPKYNPEAQQLVDGTIPLVEEVKAPPKKNKFDFGIFFAICGLVTFPLFIITLAVRTFKEVSEDIPGRKKQQLGRIKIEPVINRINTEYIPKETKPKKTTVISHPKNRDIPNKAETSINKYFTSPLKSIPNPMLLNTSPLSTNKGLCLVEYNFKYSLIGYINDEIFLLNQFDYLPTKEIRSRLAETIANKDRYIIRIGEYKALVEVTEANMNLLIEL